MKKIYKICGIIALSCAILLSSIGLMFSSSPTLAYDLSFTGEALKTTYVLGETFVAPEAKVSVGGIELDSTKQVLCYPNGTAISDDSYQLSSAGEYVIKYYAMHNGKSVYAQKSFMVEGDIISLSGRHSTASYGTTGSAKGDHQGLVVSLASGETFTYNKPLNLNGKSQNETLLSMFVIPENKGVADVTEFTVRLTDAINPDNYIEIYQWSNPYDNNEAKGQALYAGVRAHNQTLTGTAYKDGSSEDTIVGLDGNYYRVYKNIHTYEELGYPSYMASLTAREGYDYVENKNFCSPFNYYFNYSELQIYGNAQEAGRKLGNNMIADFDDNQYFDTLWNGFTTGEVYLSIYSKGYNNAMFNFVIEKIYDEDLSVVTYDHKDAPSILLDIEKDSTPFAILNNEYNIIPAKAYSSIDGVLDCDVLVFEDYYGDKKAVPVNNGAFVPTKLNTTYHIIYIATDSYGLETVEVREIEVRSEREVQILIQDEDDETLTGVNTLLKTPEISGMNGEYTFDVVVKKGNNETVVDLNKDGEYEFWTLEAGVYEVIYRLNDYNGIFEESYTLNVESNPNSIFLGDSRLPKAFAKGGIYVLPEIKGAISGSSQEVNASIKYKFDDGTVTDYTSGSALTIQATQNVQIIYTLENAASDLVFDVPVTDVGLEEEEFYKDKYFYAQNFVSQAGPNSVTYTSEIRGEDASLSYVKPVLVANMSFGFKILSDMFKSMTFKFNDPYTENTVALKFDNIGANKYNVTVNGGQDVQLSIPLMSKQFSLNFDGVNGVISVFGKTFTIENFEQFTNHLAYFEVEFESVTSTKIEIFNFCGQTISSVAGDISAPAYYLDMEKGRKLIGDYIIIKGFYVEDVFRFTHNKSITVKGPDRTVCTTVDEVRMLNITDFSREYKILIDKAGAYTVTGSYDDGMEAGYDLSKGIKIQAINSAPPVITVSTQNKVTDVKVGQTYTLPTATAVDNAGNTVGVYTLVMDVDEKVKVITNGKFTFEKKGTYVVMFYAYDSNGIVAYDSYTVKAS